MEWCHFTTEGRKRIRAALRLAEQMIAIGFSRMNEINSAADGKIRISKRRKAWRKAWESTHHANPALWTKSPAAIWFGKWTRRRMKRIFRVLQRMRRIVSNRRIIFRPITPVNRDKEGTYTAYALVLVGRRRIWLHPTFFGKELDCQAQTIVHEMAHSVAWIRDKAYRIDSLKLSGRNRIKNADTYGFYCLSQYYLALGRGEADVAPMLVKGPRSC
jgi:hypothetical protein